ncbi:MAG: undecaprenyl-phosphate glucose phosphotransferase [Chloroflexi bacterium]|nr:undecaprenyl-phosphate glucose phosphotransferase [Chloroflexota bacterium]MDA8189234.1 undecaprenyl-phosphate glucose phosphotransferase [Dehalococcoidales bacterium]
MRKSANVYFSVALVAIDIIALIVSYYLGYRVRFESNVFGVQEMQPFGVYLGPLALQVILTPPIFAMHGLYKLKRSGSWVDPAYSAFAALSVATLVVMAVSAIISRDFGYSRMMLAFVWLLSLIFVLIGRVVHSRVQSFLRALDIGQYRVLIVGTDDIAKMILDKMRHSPGLGYRAVGFVTEEPGPASVFGVPVVGTVENVGTLVKEYRIDEVIVAIPTLSRKQLLDIVAKCQKQNVNIRCYPDLFQIMASEVSISDLDGLPLVTVRDVALKGWNLAIKRWVDLVFSAAGLVVLSPFLLFLAFLVKLTSPEGSVFYTQERVGLDGKPFQIFKFRSMRPDAEGDTGPVWAKRGDDRTTRIGRVLRRYSFDELPQLMNVLIGEMSLVGPRPERPHFVEQFKQTVPRYFERHNEKAGITGWAQVNGLRGNTSIEERTAYDLWYVENWTLWLDFKILVQSLFVIFRDKNAY